MTPEAELVLAIAKEIVFDQKSNILDLIQKGSIDWSRFKEIIIYHGLTPFVYPILKDYLSLLPEDLNQTLKATYYYSLNHLLQLEQEFLVLYDVFRKRKITLIPIKGVALLEDLYSKYPVRSSADIDILVKEESLEEAIRVLEELGYKKNLEGLKEEYWRKKQYHFVFGPSEERYSLSDNSLTEQTKKGLKNHFHVVELHWDLDYRRYRRRLLPEMFGRLREFTIQGKKIKLLSFEDTFFALALHQRRFGTTLSLRNVCDMALLLNKYKSTFDWNYLLNESKKLKLCSTIYFALCQVDLFFKIGVPEYVWKGLNVHTLKKKIIQRFIEKNTFLPQLDMRAKSLYLKAHFLLYDNLWEPIDYILNIPYEQFAKYYHLTPYNRKTDLFYKGRLLYIPLKVILNLASRRN